MSDADFRVGVEVDWSSKTVCLTDLSSQVTVVWSLLLDRIAVKGACNMALDLPVSSYVDLSVGVADRFGNPTKFQQGSSQWSTSDDTLLELRDPTDDGTTATVRIWPLGGANPVRVSWTCDVDLGEGVKPLPVPAFLDVSLLAGEASAATITSGTVIEKPPEPPAPPTPPSGAGETTMRKRREP